jgi:hypothetical protein
MAVFTDGFPAPVVAVAVLADLEAFCRWRGVRIFAQER